jgi:hypothetical protein
MQKEIIQKLPTAKLLKLSYRPTTILGLIFFIAGILFSSVFLNNLDFIELLKLNGNTKTTQGTVTNIFDTKMTINESEVYGYEYEYQIANEYFKWQSFSSQTSANIGDSVTIKYCVDSPEYSVIKGYQTFEGGMSSLFVLIFPFIGAIFLFSNIRKGLNYSNIINNGILTYGNYSHKEATQTEINGQTVYKLYFNYEDRNKKKHTFVIKTHKTDRLTDEEKELIVYKKDSPNKALAVDDLPKSGSKYIKKNWIK